MKSSWVLTVVSAFAFSPALTLAASETKVFTGKGLERLELRNTSGDTKIEVSSDDKAHITATKVSFDSTCSLTMKKDDNSLVASVTMWGIFGSGSCKVNFVIKIPASLALDLKTGSGSLTVKGTQGTVDFKTGSGNAEFQVDTAKLVGRIGSGRVKAMGSIDSVNLKSGSGNIELSGLRGDAKIATGSGDIKLTYSSTPKKGRVELKTGSGDAIVYLPTEAKISTRFSSGSGKVSNELGDSREAPFVVSAKSGSGDLTVKKLL